MNRKWYPLWYLLIGAVIILCDQITKQWALSALHDGPMRISSWLTLRLVFNRGISWGMFSSEHALLFWLITFAILVITLSIAVMAYRSYLKNRFFGGELLVMAGAISNLIDRFAHRGVIDFIELSYKGWAWPIFNIADCSIVLGVICIFITQYRK